MQPVKNALPLPSTSLAQEARAEVIGAPGESRTLRVGSYLRELFHARFDTWVSGTPEDEGPNIRIQHLPAAALSPAALSLIARREEDAQQLRANTIKR